MGTDYRTHGDRDGQTGSVFRDTVPPFGVRKKLGVFHIIHKQKPTFELK